MYKNRITPTQKPTILSSSSVAFPSISLHFTKFGLLGFNPSFTLALTVTHSSSRSSTQLETKEQRPSYSLQADPARETRKTTGKTLHRNELSRSPSLHSTESRRIDLGHWEDSHESHRPNSRAASIPAKMPPKIDNPTALAVTAISHWALSICIWVEFIQYCLRIFETRRPWYMNFLGYMALLSSFLFTYLILAILCRAVISNLLWRKATNRPSIVLHNQQSRADITASDSWARSSDSKAEYMALPPELRNQIMKYVLTPGTIYLPQMGPTMSKYIITRPPKSPIKRSFLEKAHRAMDQSDCFWANIIVHGIGNLHFGQNSLYPPPGAPVGKRRLPGNRGSVHGFQLLATSKTVLREGQAFFWSENTFYLPRGGFEAAEFYFYHNRHEHKTLIRYIGIQFSL